MRSGTGKNAHNQTVKNVLEKRVGWSRGLTEGPELVPRDVEPDTATPKNVGQSGKGLPDGRLDRKGGPEQGDGSGGGIVATEQKKKTSCKRD